MAPNLFVLWQVLLRLIANVITAPDKILRSGPSGSCPDESKPRGEWLTDRRRQSRTLHLRTPRYRAIIAAIAEMRLRASRDRGRSHTTARPVASGAAWLRRGYGG